MENQWNTLISFFMGPRKEILQTEQLYSLYTLKKKNTQKEQQSLLSGLNPMIIWLYFPSSPPLHPEGQPRPRAVTGMRGTPKARSGRCCSALPMWSSHPSFTSPAAGRVFFCSGHHVPGLFHRWVTFKFFWAEPTKKYLFYLATQELNRYKVTKTKC